MDYERIEKPTTLGGGISPRKLRALLLGVEKWRKGEEKELETRCSVRSELGEVEPGCESTAETCKDVGIVSLSSMVRLPEEDLLDVENVSSGFEFLREERPPQHRSALMPPFSKPAPSKWDDAQKWIPVTTSNRQGKQVKKTGFMGYGGRQQAPPAKVVLEVMEEVETKRIDLNQCKNEMDGQKEVSWVTVSSPVVDSSMKSNPIAADSSQDSSVSAIHHDVTSSAHNTSTFVSPPTTVKSVSMRDMGTEMTPLASQEPSRTGTPIRATSPSRSPTSSRPSTPTRAERITTRFESTDLNGDKRLSEKELRIKTRREIMALGTQLGKMNIAAWASKEEDDESNASTYLKAFQLDQRAKVVIETRAAAWEEAEKAKYLARFKQEEINIQAWENHQKAKTEAEMRKIEVEVERMRVCAHEKLMNKLAASRLKAEEKLAAAEERRNQQAARTAEQAENIRRTGLVPRSFSSSCCRWCF